MKKLPLDSLLVLCPTANGLSFHTEVTLDGLTAQGARKVRSNGNSCVAMHRCQVAGQAMKLLQEEPGRTECVLWLDGDMVADACVVAELADLVRAMCQTRPIPEEIVADWKTQGHDVDKQRDLMIAWRKRMAPAISGAYVKRNAPTLYALRRACPPLPSLYVTQATINPDGSSVSKQHELPAIVSGMGCLMQTAEAFLAHCEEAPMICPGHKDSFPAITGSGPAMTTDNVLGWGSEDWTYTSWEWQRERGVYLARHLRFGHVGQTTFWPTDETELDD